MASKDRFVPASELVRRLKLHMPVHLDGLVDPLGNEFSVHRENLLALLTTSMDALPFDQQSISPLYMEMARAQRSCEWGAEQLEVRFVQWKAQRAAEYRDKSEKKPTVAEVEGFYRTHSDYEEMSMAPKSLRVLASLFSDAKNAFLLKGRAQEQQTQLLRGHESSLRYDDQQQRLSEFERLDQDAEAVFQDSGSATSAAAYVQRLQENQ